MGIHFICVDIRGAQYKCFLALLFLQPWGLHEGWLFVHFFFPSSSPLLLFFLHSEASSKCNCRQGALSQRLGQHLSACSAAARPRHPHSRHPTPVTPLPAVALPGSRGRTAVVPIGSHLVLLHCQHGAIGTGTRCRWAEESQEVPTAAPALSPPA